MIMVVNLFRLIFAQRLGNHIHWTFIIIFVYVRLLTSATTLGQSGPVYNGNQGLVGWLVVFYGISILVGYLMPNPAIYIYIYVC